MSLKLVVTLFLFNSIVLFSQEKTKKHTIVKGETVSSIAEKYEVKPSEIYKLNPKAKNLLKLNSVLLIPTTAIKNTNSKTKIVTNHSEKEHEVLAKETLYGIAKEYGITLKELNQANPTLETSGLKIGQKITIPDNAKSNTDIAIVPRYKKESQKTPVETVSPARESAEVAIIEVLPKESKYSIAKKYGITIKELDKLNPSIGVKSLRVGQKINIPANASIAPEVVVVPQESKPTIEELPVRKTQSIKDSSEKEIAFVHKSKKEKVKAEIAEKKQPSVTTSPTAEDIIREVLPKETKYGIAKQYGITVQELEKQNPEVKMSLPVGYKLNIRASNTLKEEVVIITNADVNNKEVSSKEVSNNGNTVEENSSIETTKAEIKTFVSMARNSDFLDQLIERASENIGTRYQTGGTSKSGFDCSGLMCNTFGAFDIKLPRSSIEQSDFGVKVDAEEAKKGDLIFFKTNGRNQINHVGLVVEVCDGEIKFIHASVGNGVIISSTKENYYKKKVVQVNRVL